MSISKRVTHRRMLPAAIVILAASGAWLSGQLVKQRSDIWGAQAARSGLFMRICGAAERVGFDCAAAVKGRWGQFAIPIPLPSRQTGIRIHRLDVPTAFVGLAYFVFVIVWFTSLGRPERLDGRWRVVPTILAGTGAASSAVFMGLMAFGAAPWCLWCVAIHLINFVMILAIWRLASDATRAETRHETGAPESPISTREAIRTVAFALILIAGLWMYRREHVALGGQMNKLRPYKALVASLQADPKFVLREHHAQPRRAIPPRESDDAAADLPRLTVFTDFECSACFCNWQTIKGRIAKAFDGRLTLDVRHYPLCRDCNDQVKGELHPNACDAARAAEAARLQGGREAFGRMYDLLFKNRNRLGEALYRRLAERIGLDADRLLSDMRSEIVEQVIESDIALARKLGVRGTPTMFLDGRRITALCQGDVFWTAVAASSASHTGKNHSPEDASQIVATDSTVNQRSRQP